MSEVSCLHAMAGSGRTWNWSKPASAGFIVSREWHALPFPVVHTSRQDPF